MSRVLIIASVRFWLDNNRQENQSISLIFSDIKEIDTAIDTRYFSPRVLLRLNISSRGHSDSACLPHSSPDSICYEPRLINDVFSISFYIDLELVFFVHRSNFTYIIVYWLSSKWNWIQHTVVRTQYWNTVRYNATLPKKKLKKLKIHFPWGAHIGLICTTDTHCFNINVIHFRLA